MKFSRAWAMPSPNTFTIKPIAALLARYLAPLKGKPIVDPFARASRLATHTNDLDGAQGAQHALDAVEYLDKLLAEGMEGQFGAALLDPPYSSRQLAEVYGGLGRKMTMTDMQIGTLYRKCKHRMGLLMAPAGIAITCGWSSNGFGKRNHFEMIEILLVAHGGAHNDTIVTVERKRMDLFSEANSQIIAE